MDLEKSQIDSFDVSLGAPGAHGSRNAQSTHSASSAKAPAAKALERWNILVCSDLGYASQEPVMVRIAEWNEFMASQNIVLSGTLPDPSPAYIEFPVKSMKDLTMESVMANASPFAAFSRAIFGLTQLIDGKTSRDDCLALIKKADLPQEDSARVMTCFGTPPPAPQPQKKTSALPQHSSIDNILSMVKSPSSAGDGPAPHNAAEALFKSVTGPGESGFNKQAVAACIGEFQSRLKRQGNALRTSPFFASRAASWNCLWALAKVLGRKKEAGLCVVSAPRQDMEENLDGVLSSCMESGSAPDLVVWDYAGSFTNASQDAMTRIAKTADKYKCMVVVPLAADDPLFAGDGGRQSVLHLFEEVRFLPYKKLRTEPASRCLCLCGPAGARAEWNKMRGGNCCWFVAIRWLEMLLGENNPLGARDPGRPSPDSVFSQQKIFDQDTAPAVASEAAAFGLTLFPPALSGASIDKAVTVVGRDQAAESYSSFLFNLTVNRVVRLAGVRLLSVSGVTTDRVAVAAELQAFLQTELLGYGVSDADGRVTARAAEDGTINIDVNSDVTVSGFPVRFTFSF
jgi:hypothetical protein